MKYKFQDPFFLGVDRSECGLCIREFLPARFFRTSSVHIALRNIHIYM